MVYNRTRPTPPDATTVDGIDSAAFELVANKDANSGYAGLDSGGLVPNAKLQTSVTRLGSATTVTNKVTGTNYTPNASRPTLVLISGNIALTSAQTAVVQLCSDASTPPTTVRAQATCDDAPAAGTVNHPFFFAHLVPAGELYRVNRSSGTGTVTLPYVTEIAL